MISRISLRLNRAAVTLPRDTTMPDFHEIRSRYFPAKPTNGGSSLTRQRFSLAAATRPILPREDIVVLRE